MEINLSEIKKKQKVNKGSGKSDDSSFWSFMGKDISLKKVITDTRKEKFYNDLSILVQSGIDLGSSLQILTEEERNKKVADLYKDILKDIILGRSFSEALKITKQFSDYEYYSIRIGEESGNLEYILNELAAFYKNKIRQRRLITGALTYPVLVMTIAFGAVFFMMKVIVPMFAGIFQRFGGELPGLTRKIIGFSHVISDYTLLFLIILGGIIGLMLYIRRFDWYRQITSSIALKIPVVGVLIKKVTLARYCANLSLMNISGAPLLDSLRLIGKMIGFYPMEKALKEMEIKLLEGYSLHESMKEHSIFEARLISLTKVGEETNKLDMIYRQLYEQYTAEVKHHTEQMGNLLEPMLIIFVGVLVMVILIAMYLPLFQLSTSIL